MEKNHSIVSRPSADLFLITASNAYRRLTADFATSSVKFASAEPSPESAREILVAETENFSIDEKTLNC